jgi:hypothetical protein
VRALRLLLSAVALCALCACGSRKSIAPIDLLRELPRAERRAARPVDQAIRSDLVDVGGDVRPAIVTDAPARVTWSLRLPSSAWLRTEVALVPDSQQATPRGVTVRVGVSDDRSYDELLRQHLDPSVAGHASSWMPLEVNLEEYAGWKWSLFYHPARTTWRLIINADAAPGGAVAWVRPMIVVK